MNKKVAIGNGQGFWGDSERGPVQLVRGGGIDYLTMDFLAELTMSILQKMRSRDPQAGYATDFISQLKRILPDCVEHGIKIVANAGGVNPAACAGAVNEVVAQLGLNVTVAVVDGDDILAQLPELIANGHSLANMTSAAPLAEELENVLSANVYLGAFPIAQALDAGADIVITGRVADAALVLGPLIHEFGWSETDYDRLAAGMVAGHIIECGTQCTGGNYDRWEAVPNLVDIGFPIVEVLEDGSFVVTKKPGTGGLVDIHTVTAQLLYEIGDPSRYLTPDVVADFTSAHLQQVGPDRVRVSGVTGTAPTDSYKVSVSIRRGWRIAGQLTVGGPDAEVKARVSADILLARLAQEGISFHDDDCRVEILGTNVLYEGMFEEAGTPPTEVVLRVSARSEDKAALNRLGAELASLLTSGPPGLTGFAGGRPKASEIAKFWPALIAKSAVKANVNVKEVVA